jgi:hypothetical protein
MGAYGRVVGFRRLTRSALFRVPSGAFGTSGRTLLVVRTQMNMMWWPA